MSTESKQAGGKGERSGPEAGRMQGHWLLAKLGKRILRPGGRALTAKLLEQAKPSGDDDIVELGPGVGATADSRARRIRHPRLSALWMLLNWRLQLRPDRDLLKSRGSKSGQNSPLPFLRRHGFSAVYNGGGKPEKSRVSAQAGATQEASRSDKDHSVGAGVKALVMTPFVISPLSKRSGGAAGG